MFSNCPSLSSIHERYCGGIRRSSSGAIPSLLMCQVSMAMPPLGAPAPPTTSTAVSIVFTVASKGMISYTTFASVCSAASAQSSAKRSVSTGTSHAVPGMLPTLMWCASNSAAARIDEPVHDELELEVAQAAVVEDLLHLREAPRLEHVLQVGVPDPDAAEPD